MTNTVVSAGLALFSAAAMTLAAADPATAPAPLAAKGPWTVHYDDDLCLMERRFPVGGDELMLAFQPLLDLPTVELSLIAPDRQDRQYIGKFTADIEPGGRHFAGSYFSAISTTKPGTRVTRLTIERAALDGLRDGDVLHVHAKPIELAFAMAKPDKALAALKACDDDLRRAWGIATPPPAQPPVFPRDIDQYFAGNTYPRMALENGIQGRVIVLLNVSPEGRVTHCRIVSSAGQMLNEGTCKVAMTLRFKPARDAVGVAVASSYVMPVRWTLDGR